MYHGYYPPDTFCFDCHSTNDPPIVDDKRLATYNVEERIDSFHDFLLHMKEHYRTNHLLITAGGDFQYQNALFSFKNWEKLMTHFNSKYKDFKLIYSTPQEYLAAIHKTNIKLPTKYDDLFPYADGPNAYWTGYFTSRANLKGFVREGSSIYHLNQKLLSFLLYQYDLPTTLTDPVLAAQTELHEALGVLQHHDAVSGTEKQHVAEDYARILNEGVLASNKALYELLSLINHGVDRLDTCYPANGTYLDCPTRALGKSEKTLVVSAMNLSPARRDLLKLKVPNEKLVLEEFASDGHSLIRKDADFLCEKRVEGDQTVDDCAMLLSEDFETLHARTFYLSVDDKEGQPSKEAVSVCVDDEPRIATSTQSLTYKGEEESGILFQYRTCEATDRCSESPLLLEYRFYDSF